jgi:hypothetical protein
VSAGKEHRLVVAAHESPFAKGRPACLARGMHTRNQQNRKQVIWFGMLLGGFLLGCPPAAKSPDQKQEKAKSATGASDRMGEEPAEKPEKKPDSPPVPVGGGW